ncbi:MAG TPA: ABC transporter substrate-binding protein [Spirochaetales bacterium]|nr:ABC transporter substrate-binding protein [Spirochaetales bacterium]HQK33610.1 ABC transporter substrate-binding protein [Spirochaetales bacterium]
MKKKFIAVLLTVLSVSLILAGCSQKTTEIKIGGVGPVSGEAATFGQSTKEGYELAVEEWNKAGGLLGNQIKLIFQDDKGDPTEAATVWTKLISQDKVVAIVGTVMSKCSLAGAPISQANKVPMISPTSTNPKVTEVGEFIFRACFIDPFQGTVGAKFAYENLNARTAACIFDVGNDYTKGLSEFFRDKFIELGGEIVAFEAHATGATDFKAQLTKIIAAKPDVIYISDYYNDVALIAKQARELGYTGPLVGGDGWDSPDLVKIGGKAVENGYFTNHFSKDDPSPQVQEFVRKYEAKFGKTPDALAALAYDAMVIMLDAIKRAGSTDPEKIRAALAATNIQVVSGMISFDKNRNPIKSAVIIAIKDGQQVYQTTVNP